MNNNQKKTTAKETINTDSIFYRDSKKGMRLIVKARIAMFQLFLDQVQPNAHSKIIDIGVSGEENDGANFLEQHYQWPSQITCAGIGDGANLKLAHPQVSFVNIEPNKRLPFPDNYFDISYSNAVIEHVGGQSARAFFATMPFNNPILATPLSSTITMLINYTMVRLFIYVPK